MRCCTAGLLSLLLVVAGCEESPPISADREQGAPASRASAPPPPPRADDPVQTAEEDDDAYERQVAEVGVGKRGRNYGGGVISEPIRQYFRAGDRIQLLNMERAMKMYKAEHGKLPATHEDFMQKIIEVNSIELPELPEGERYVYDPERGELMVEKPKR